jgi:hypothetical protein
LLWFFTHFACFIVIIFELEHFATPFTSLSFDATTYFDTSPSNDWGFDLFPRHRLMLRHNWLRMLASVTKLRYRFSFAWELLVHEIIN